MQDYHGLEIWQRAMDYVVAVHHLCARLPDAERYALTAQIRKAAISVPLNIAEGSGCQTSREFAKFLGYAYRSLKEVLTCLELCARLYPQISADTVTRLIDEGNQLSRMTFTLIQRVGSS